MEQDGFTMVSQDVANSSRKKGRDAFQNVVTGISQEEADRAYEQVQEQKRQKVDDEDHKYTTNKAKKNAIKQDFYMF